MSWLLSTGLKERMKGNRSAPIHAVYGTGISFSVGTGTNGRDQILDSGAGLAGFTVGDQVGALNGTNSGVSARILSVAAGALEVAAGTVAAESAGTGIFLITSEGGSFLDCFKNCFIDLRTGAVPASADLVEGGNLLVTLTRDGDGTTGVNFSDSGTLTASIENDPDTDAAEVIKGTPIATGTAVSCWIYDKNHTTGASSTSVRMVGNVAKSGSDCNMPNGTTVTTGVDVEGTSVAFTF